MRPACALITSSLRAWAQRGPERHKRSASTPGPSSSAAASSAASAVAASGRVSSLPSSIFRQASIRRQPALSLASAVRAASPLARSAVCSGPASGTSWTQAAAAAATIPSASATGDAAIAAVISVQNALLLRWPQSLHAPSTSSGPRDSSSCSAEPTTVSASMEGDPRLRDEATGLIGRRGCGLERWRLGAVAAAAAALGVAQAGGQNAGAVLTCLACQLSEAEGWQGQGLATSRAALSNTGCAALLCTGRLWLRAAKRLEVWQVQGARLQCTRGCRLSARGVAAALA